MISDIKEEKDRNMKEKIIIKNKSRFKELKKSSKGVTLIALVITILFSYDEKIKCSNSKGFLLTTIL